MICRKKCMELFYSPACRSAWFVSRSFASFENNGTGNIQPDGRQVKKIVKKFLPSVVTLTMSKGTKENRYGGIIVDPLGYIVTSVEDIRSQRKEYLSKFKVDVHLNAGMPSEYTLPGEVAYADMVNKFAIVKCKSDKPLEAAKLNDYFDSFFLYLSTTRGQKNTLPNSIVADLVNFRPRDYCPSPVDITKSCVFSSGIAQSEIFGLALVNLNGELAGIFNGVVNKLNFATSAKVISKVLEILKKHGNCQPWIGADFSLEKKYGIHQVHKVFPDSPAEDAGLRVGDRIVKFGGDSVRSFVELYNKSLLGLRRPLNVRLKTFQYAVIVPSLKEQARFPFL